MNIMEKSENSPNRGAHGHATLRLGSGLFHIPLVRVVSLSKQKEETGKDEVKDKSREGKGETGWNLPFLTAFCRLCLADCFPKGDERRWKLHEIT